MKPTLSGVKGLHGQVVERAGLLQPVRTSHPPTFHILPWDSGQYVYPTTIYTDHGNTQFYAEFGNDLYTTFLVTNALDGTTYLKRNDKGYNDIMQSPDLILGPMKTATLTVDGEDIGIVSSVAGTDFETSRPLLSSSPTDQYAFNPRGVTAGVYFSDPDRQPVLNMPDKYIRQYDIYDISNSYPSDAPTFRHGAQKGFTPSTFFISTGSMAAPSNWRCFNGVGASGMSGGIHISNVASGGGTAATLYLVKKFVQPGPTLAGYVITSIPFTVAVGSFTIPPISGSLESDMMFMMDSVAGPQISIDQIFASFTIA